jgi:hypothetical protein
MTHDGTSGYLATISSQGEQDFILESFPDATSYFFGAYQAPGSTEPNGGWRWVTPEPWSWTNWGASEPSNTGGVEDGAAFHSDGSWNDWSRASFPEASTLKGFIIEFGAYAVRTDESSFGALKARY